MVSGRVSQIPGFFVASLPAFHFPCIILQLVAFCLVFLESFLKKCVLTTNKLTYIYVDSTCRL
jgi:hypothetical protein